ncbi:ABC transporter permease [Sphaerisporangium rubeum]|uniref:Peptide/nickel transport system permease protein n=1 Tax=Sphaerisporangium rubeum TaxID=321317 RepID=A0A7X0II32_9ACTN|nr:ABC transporter permease [Sphaerisporangium rubeum]MBB6475375.1 peptide/nickel transport system permease protein [Sphaerisporangium rubeum]
MTADISVASRVRAVRLPKPAVLLSAAALGLILLAAVRPGLLAAGDPSGTDALNALAPPDAAHPFGTDQLGRDVFTRVVHGARYSLAIGAAATGAGLAVALVWGLASALSGRFGDAVLMRTADALLALPGLLLALMVVLIAGKGVNGATIAVAAGIAPGFARVVRAQALVVRRSGYVESAVALGVRRPLIVLRHVLPNTVGPLLVVGTVTLGASISTGAALSYLGLGAQPPTPEWGAMLTEGQGFLHLAWWIALFPGLMLVVTVVAVTVLGRHAQARSEGRYVS